ncbi:hypothetical protein EV667_1567 [Ancylobacter aquaticus]|uniref:Uncharacterized protein n=1 Tax=Ancylobacter aquaticus TaxID=100 RepID=A0A4R1I8R5_ANCAQ|nr:hypothetical protein [Ancylobacter aquaticus]TCK31458.1 hypothetical protein EV667_1567 [Ancylobacter aquaticus]
MPLAEEAWRVFVRKDGRDENDNPVHPTIGYLAGFGVKFQAEEAVLKALDDTDYLVVSSDRVESDVIAGKNLQAEQVVLD